MSIAEDNAPAVTSKPDWQGNIKEVRTKLGRMAIAMFSGKTVTNQQSGQTIKIPRSGIKKTVGHRSPKPLHQQYSVMALPEMLEAGKHNRFEPDKEKRDNIKGFHHYDATIVVDGTPYKVDLVVKETTDNQLFYSHLLTENGTSDKGPTEKAGSDQNTEKIEDFGEKIGGARKDMEITLGKQGSDSRSKVTGPAWVRPYHVGEIVRGKDEGKFSVTYDKGRFPRTLATFDTREEAAAAIPLLEAVRKHKVYPVDTERNEWGIFRNVTDRKRFVIKGGFTSREDAIAYMATHPVEFIEHKPAVPERPHLDVLERTGKQRKTEKVTPDQFTQEFGFRGTEFGNWLPQDERQQVLNYAHDALSDLATVLNVPTQALSLNGELAVGFGSRGHGLNSASAHYERNYAAINLTRLRGAGSAAHEWMHALDHYLARQSGKANSEFVGGRFNAKQRETDYVSHGFRYNSKTRKELQAAWKNVVDTIIRKQATVKIDQDANIKFLGKRETRGIEEIDTSLNRIRGWLEKQQTYGRKSGPATPEQLARYDAFADQVRKGEYGDTIDLPTKRMGGRRAFQVISDLSDVVKEVRGRTELTDHGSLNQLNMKLKNLRHLKELKTESIGINEKTQTVRTDFYSHAAEIDRTRVSDYWSTNHELLARAFESYVQDKIESSGNKSQYLVHSTDNRPYLPKKPYPEGKEREAINATFDKLFEVMESKQTDKGVALFSLRPPGSRGSSGVTQEVARATVARIQRKYPGSRSIILAPTLEDLPKAVKDQAKQDSTNPDQIRGVIHDGKLYLVLSAVSTVEDIETAYLHENYHSAMDSMLRSSSKISRTLRQLYSDIGGKAGMDKLQKLYNIDLSQYEASYSSQPKHIYEAMMTSELIAHIGQSGKPSLRQRVRELILLVKTWLAKHGFTRLANKLKSGEWALVEAMRDARNFLKNPANRPVEDPKSDSIDRPLYSLKSMKDLEDMEARQQKENKRIVRDWFANRMKDKKPAALAALTLRQLAEIGKKQLSQIETYMDVVNAMQTRRNVLAEEAGKFAEKWHNWAAKNKQMSSRLFNLMHQSTIAGVDPSEAYKVVSIKIPEYMLGEKYSPEMIEIEANRANLHKLMARRKLLAKGGGADRVVMSKYQEAINNMKTAIGHEINRSRARDAIETNWANLSPEAQQYYVQARDMYADRSHQVEEAIIKKITSTGADEKQRSAMIAKIRLEFEKARVQGPYFPLQRFGNLSTYATRAIEGTANVYRPNSSKVWNTEEAAKKARSTEKFIGKELDVVEEGDGFVLKDRMEERKFLMYETHGDQEADIPTLQRGGWKLTLSLKTDYRDKLQATSEGFVGDVITMLQKTVGDQSAKAQDEIYQMYLATLPHLSQRKHFIHRGKVEGYDPNAIRAFAFNMNPDYAIGYLKGGLKPDI